MRKYSELDRGELILYSLFDQRLCVIEKSPSASIVSTDDQPSDILVQAENDGGYNWVPSKPQELAIMHQLPMPLPSYDVSYRSGRPRKWPVSCAITPIRPISEPDVDHTAGLMW